MPQVTLLQTLCIPSQSDNGIKNTTEYKGLFILMGYAERMLDTIRPNLLEGSRSNRGEKIKDLAAAVQSC